MKAEDVRPNKNFSQKNAHSKKFICNLVSEYRKYLPFFIHHNFISSFSKNYQLNLIHKRIFFANNYLQMTSFEGAQILNLQKNS